MTVYIPVHTSCSTCGSGDRDRNLGVAFFTREEADTFLANHPNTDPQWGEGQGVREVQLVTDRQEGTEPYFVLTATEARQGGYCC